MKKYNELVKELYYAHMANNYDEVLVIADYIEKNAKHYNKMEAFVLMCVVNATEQSLTQ